MAANFGFSVSHFANAVRSSSVHSMYSSMSALSRAFSSRLISLLRNRAMAFRLKRLCVLFAPNLGFLFCPNLGFRVTLVTSEMASLVTLVTLLSVGRVVLMWIGGSAEKSGSCA